MRLIAAGEACLVEGFELIGFETSPNATPADFEKLLGELARSKEKALVFLEQSLVRDPGANYLRLREGSAFVLMVEIPPLNTPASYRPAVDALVQRMLGAAALEEK
jgi:vacuolar-type H+-ATPase subunit F/Vma7